MSNTYGHSQLKTGHPVRSAIHKQLNGRLVLRWVTTWESLLLYVLHLLVALLRATCPCPYFYFIHPPGTRCCSIHVSLVEATDSLWHKLHVILTRFLLILASS
ncbi:hypothetical protein KCU85_g7176, partial [Aureobasidium melanogenum]